VSAPLGGATHRYLKTKDGDDGLVVRRAQRPSAQDRPLEPDEPLDPNRRGSLPRGRRPAAPLGEAAAPVGYRGLRIWLNQTVL